VLGKVSADMSSSGYTQLPSDPPPAYVPAEGYNKGISQVSVPSIISAVLSYLSIQYGTLCMQWHLWSVIITLQLHV